MKKTLVALLALGGMASATDTIIGNADQPASLIQNGGIVVSAGSISSTMTAGQGTQKNPSSTDYRNSFRYAPGNIGDGTLTSATYTLTFTVDSIAEGTVGQGITIDFFSLNGNGAPQNTDNGYNVAVTLKCDQQQVEQYVGPIVTSRGDNHQSAAAYNEGGITINPKSSYYQLDLADVDWTAGTYTLEVQFSRHATYTTGCFAGIGNVTLHSQTVPEPATGSLSLLALAGLCARRRKK